MATIATIMVESPAFAPGQAIPVRHTDDGEDVSPTLSWSGLPEGTRGLALICDDPDAPSREPWVHWVIYRIPPDTTGLPEGVADAREPDTPAGAVQGTNSWGTIGYRGPAPPRGHGVHHYRFRLYALDGVLDVVPGLDKSALLAAMSGHVLGEGQIVGTYQR